MTGLVRTVLVVGAETLSRITDLEDRNTAVLFGDGAGAAVLRRASGNSSEFLAGRLAGSKSKKKTAGSTDPFCGAAGASCRSRA